MIYELLIGPNAPETRVIVERVSSNGHEETRVSIPGCCTMSVVVTGESPTTLRLEYLENATRLSILQER